MHIPSITAWGSWSSSTRSLKHPGSPRRRCTRWSWDFRGPRPPPSTWPGGKPAPPRPASPLAAISSITLPGSPSRRSDPGPGTLQWRHSPQACGARAAGYGGRGTRDAPPAAAGAEGWTLLQRSVRAPHQAPASTQHRTGSSQRPAQAMGTAAGKGIQQPAAACQAGTPSRRTPWEPTVQGARCREVVEGDHPVELGQGHSQSRRYLAQRTGRDPAVAILVGMQDRQEGGRLPLPLFG